MYEVGRANCNFSKEATPPPMICIPRKGGGELCGRVKQVEGRRCHKKGFPWSGKTGRR